MLGPVAPYVFISNFAPFLSARVTKIADTSLSIRFHGKGLTLLGYATCDCYSIFLDGTLVSRSSPSASVLTMFTGLEDTEHTISLYLDSHDTESRITLDKDLISLPSILLSTRSVSETMSPPSASPTHSSFPGGTIAALVLAGILAIVIVIAILSYILYYRPKKRRQRQHNAPPRVEEAKGDVLDISAGAVAQDQRGCQNTGMTQWADEVEGRGGHGWHTLARLGLAFKKSSSSGNGDGYDTPLSSESVRSVTHQAPTSKGNKTRLWKASWSSSRRPSHSIELQTTRSSSPEDTKSVSDGVSSLYFAPLANGVPQGPQQSITISHPYSTSSSTPRNNTLPRFSIHPPTPLGAAPTHSIQTNSRPPSGSLNPVPSVERKDLPPLPREGSDHGSATNLDGTRDCVATAVRSLSPRTSEAASVESHSSRPFLEVQPNSPFAVPLTITETDEGYRPKRFSGLSVRFEEGGSLIKGKGKERADDLVPNQPHLQPSSSRTTPKSAVKASRDAVTSFLDLGGSSREGSGRSSASSSPQKRYSNLPIPPHWIRNDGSSTELRSGWSSSTPSGQCTSEPSPIEPEVSRWSHSAPSGISENQNHSSGSGEVSGSSQSSTFPYPLSLPPSPHHPEHIVRRQPPARLLPIPDPARRAIPSSVLSAYSPQSSQFSPSEVHFRHSFSDETDTTRHTSSGLPPHPPLPNSRPITNLENSYIVQRVLGRQDAPTSPLTPHGRGVDVIP